MSALTRTSRKPAKKRDSTAPRSRPRSRPRPARSPSPRGSEKPPAAEVAAALPVEAPAPDPEAAPEPAPAVIIVSAPEPALAARVPEPEPERALPSIRRAVFFDVENSSRPEHIARVLDHLGIDRHGRRTDIIAVGNWKVASPDTARLLAKHGAHLVHSAPASGVRDWSDLRIAVTAGVWLAGARPGDVVEIITDDRAFDAVGDVAASLGIGFRRLSYRGLVGAPREAPAAAAPAKESADQRSRRRRRGRRPPWRETAAGPAPAPAPPPPAPAALEPVAPAMPVAAPTAAANGAGAEAQPAPHTAPHDEIVSVVRDLIERSPSAVISLDALANALKARGFARTPGSPRLITRLRRIKEVSVSRAGQITLVGDGAVSPAVAEVVDGGETPPLESVLEDEPQPFGPIRPPAVEAEEQEDEGPGPGNERYPPARPVHAQAGHGQAAARRRRGGRRGRGPRPRAATP